jgi:ABC-type oligopeptide transport system substrate-binding subunit
VRNGCRLLVAIVAGASLIASACSSGDRRADVVPTGLAFADPTTSSGGEPGGTLRVGVTGVDSLDPARANAASPSSMLVADLLFDGLTGYDATKGTVVGVLAR